MSTWRKSRTGKQCNDHCEWYDNNIYKLHTPTMSFTKLATSIVPSTISVRITTSASPMLGQNIYILTCNESLPDNFNPSITYQWTKDNGTQTQVGTMKSLSFSPLKLSDTGRYTCVVTASAFYLRNTITTTVSRDIRLQSKSLKKKSE